MRILSGLVAVAVSSSVAHAQPSTPPQDEVSPAAAGMLSLLATSAGVALTIGSSDPEPSNVALGLAIVAIGPSIGHWYAHEWWSPGLIIRAAGAAALAGGLVGRSCGFESECGHDPRDNLVTFGALAFVIGTVADIVTAPSAARHYNRQHAAQLQVVPIASPTTAGIALTSAF
jgi:hypothetical protein